MITIPKELNWVDKRAACAIATVFNQLCNGITADVEAANSARQLSEIDRFSAAMHSTGTVIFVGRPNRTPRARVIVGVVDDRIEVHQEWDGGNWNVTVGLNEEGRCILWLDGKEMEQWQFRKKALEELFFGD